jgi:hypothetical protein
MSQLSRLEYLPDYRIIPVLGKPSHEQATVNVASVAGRQKVGGRVVGFHPVTVIDMQFSVPRATPNQRRRTPKTRMSIWTKCLVEDLAMLVEKPAWAGRWMGFHVPAHVAVTGQRWSTPLSVSSRACPAPAKIVSVAERAPPGSNGDFAPIDFADHEASLNRGLALACVNSCRHCRNVHDSGWPCNIGKGNRDETDWRKPRSAMERAG